MRSVRIPALLTVSFAMVTATAAFAQAPAAARAAAATITAEDVKARIAFLASDALRGRDTPSPGLETAAKYVADQFASFGLKPAGDSGSFIQRWPYESRSLATSKVHAELHGATSHRPLAFGSEFFVIPSPTVDSMAGEIVFGGVASAATTPNPAYAGKLVAFAVPGAGMNAEWMGNVRPAIGAGIGSGARGVVLILDPGFTADTLANLVNNLGSAMTPIPVLGIRNDVAATWLKGTQADMQNATAVVAGPVAVTGATLALHTAMNGISARPPNVVGILEGSDPVLKDTYIVYSAHMDHIGVGRPNAKGDSINNGADDDASGTTAVIEVAQAFASMKERPKRSIIFLTVSGEEKGLFGSKYFTEHTPVPADKIVADINIDMIGRNAPDTTVAIGQDYSSLGTITQAVVKAHPELKLLVAPDLWPEESLFTRSDHFNFAMKKIPAIFFTSGLHKDYHQPSDEPATIDNDKLARTARLVFWLGNEVANTATAPVWTKAGLDIISTGGN